MANLLLAIPNFVDAIYSATFSGGSWEASLPLTNLRDRRLSRVARSTGVALADTKFDVDLKKQYTLRVIAIPKHTLQLSAKIRVRGSNASNFSSSVYDSGWLDVFGVMYPHGSVPWGHPGFWSGRLSAEELALGYNVGFTLVLSSPQTARYWRIEVDDTTNTDGYIDLARLILALGYQPAINMQVGAQIGYKDSSTSTESPGGAMFYNAGAKRRAWNFTVPLMSEDQALVGPFDIARRYGTTEQIFGIFNPDDTAHLHRRSFLGVIRSLSLLDYPHGDRLNAPFAFEEEL